MLLVPSNEAVDRFVADREPSLETQPAADLFGAQTFAQQACDELPVCRIQALIAACLPAAAVRLVLRMTGAVDVVAAGAVARDLSCDRAAMTVHEASDLSDRQSWNLLTERGQRIPLGEGDLVIAHCETFLPEDFRQCSRSPFFTEAVVALVL